MGGVQVTRKLPVQQLLILSICRLAEPITLTSVCKYVPEHCFIKLRDIRYDLDRRMHLEEDHTGTPYLKLRKMKTDSKPS